MPAFPNKSLALLPLSLRIHLFDDGYLFTAIEAICCEELQLTSGLYSRIIVAKLDLVDLLSKLIDTILDFLDFVEVIFLALLSEFLEFFPLLLTQLVGPLDAQMLSDLSFAQVGHPLLDLVELLVLEELVRGQNLLLSR